MRVPNLVPIGPQAATCIRPEGYTHRQTDRQTHTLSYIDIDAWIAKCTVYSPLFFNLNVAIHETKKSVYAKEFLHIKSMT